MPLNNYMNFNDTEGIYTYTFEAERKVYLVNFFVQKIVDFM